MSWYAITTTDMLAPSRRASCHHGAHAAHHVRGPAAHLGVDAADVLADQADGEDEEPEEDEQDREEREQPLALGTEHQAPEEEIDAEAGADQRHADPRERHELDRHERESRHQIEAEAHEPQR